MNQINATDMWYSDLDFLRDLDNLGDFNLDENIFEEIPWFLDNDFLFDLQHLNESADMKLFVLIVKMLLLIVLVVIIMIMN